MVKETAQMAISKGSKAFTIGEAATVAEEIPNKEATGLTHTPTQAPLLQTENKTGMNEVIPPVMLVQNDFFASINLFVRGL